MFEPSEEPRVFGIAPGVDFPGGLVEGLRDRMAGQPPHAMARVDLIVNTTRMRRRLRALFDAGPPGLLPRVLLVTELDGLVPGITAAPPVPPLRRRLELTRLIGGLLEAAPEIAPRSSLYGLSDSLAALLDEMQGEGVTAADIAALDLSVQSGHWERTQRFLQIADAYLRAEDTLPDSEARQRQLVERIIAHWQDSPPAHPVILAGSTGSRGTTALLMEAIARLPQGAIVLPGFDFEMPTAIWNALDDQLLSQDHPQYRFHHLIRQLQLPSAAVRPWAGTKPPSTARNALVSLSLRPAPVTHAWLTEGPKLKDIAGATRDLTLIEADTPRKEALAIALRLRKAVDEGKTAALITPDRMLTRQVTSALDRWDILPDDSAGTPLQLSPPGRFLRHVAALLAEPLDAEGLLTLLKHPLTHSGADRGYHQLHTQRLEMAIRRMGLPYPDTAGLRGVAETAAEGLEDPVFFMRWADWVAATLTGRKTPGERPLSEWVALHLDLASRLAAGQDGPEAGELWQKKAGQKALGCMTNLQEQAIHGGMMGPGDYADLLGALLSQEEVRDRDAPRSDVMIWGTLEARVQGADLVILGGLNDGVWPEAPAPDPWLNRQMRLDAGLLLPERRIGLSAHDYQQAIAAPEVVLSRSLRSDEAETVPSRWLNRLGNLLQGLPKQGGDAAWEDMRARGNQWLAQVEALEAVTPVPPAPRPSPRPPVAARPRALSVTEIKTLIRDPYAIYAKHVLRLRPIDPLMQTADALTRGIAVHEIMEHFVREAAKDPDSLNRDRLMQIAREVLQEQVPWHAARKLWLARIERIADWFVAGEQARLAIAEPVAFERDAGGTHLFDDIGFTIRGTADRIDRTREGEAIIYDYKTGKPPTKEQQRFFDKQLLIEAAMVEEGAFSAIGPANVAGAIFIGLGTSPAEVAAPLEEETPAETMMGLHKLLSAYLQPAQGFTSRRMMEREGYGGVYDQLARFGEWDTTQLPEGPADE
ncbi:MAG: double-strand break repair protein AddB [Rhodobacteraceae bacterium]|nr:double-strand break repair protein AddB [Paracoccaceae bacterium]MBO28239.1 double-strand break repair protein AddB [Paracoccaceae bacterium]